MKKPIIGIVTKHFKEKGKRPNMYIRDEVKQAIFDNGGIAIGITLPKDDLTEINNNWGNSLNPEEFDNLITQIKLCDGIIFQGGAASDNYEVIVAKYCFDNDIPALGLCCGQNIMVRAVGGTTKRIDNPEKHFNTEKDYVHTVTINKDSYLYKIIQKEVIKVNSRHKKTVDTHPGLDVSCTCEDGYIDGVEAKNKNFYMAFRFHPESLYKIDKNHNDIFKEFIKICSKNAQ